MVEMDPSFSAGWVASEEEFMQWIKPISTHLNLGHHGDRLVIKAYQIIYMFLLCPRTIHLDWSNGTRVGFVGSPAAIDPNIQWQDIETKNLGVDIGLLGNSLNVSFDIFERNTNNMIVPKEGIPLTFGARAPLGNYGTLETSGWDLPVDYGHRFENGLGINLRGNISDSKIILTEYGTGTQVTGNYNGKTLAKFGVIGPIAYTRMRDFELDANGKPILITLSSSKCIVFRKQANQLKSADGKKPVYQAFLQNSANFLFGPGDVKFRM